METANASLSDVQMPRVGSVVGRFRLERLLSEDGEIATFGAINVKDSSLATVRVLLIASIAGERAKSDLREAVERLRRAASAGVEPILALEQLENGVWVLVSPAREGETLASRLAESGPMSPREVATLIPKVIALMMACNVAGLKGVIPRPETLWVLQDGSMRLTDAGLSYLLRGPNLRPSTLAETVYSPPEVLRGGTPELAGEMYSLGVLVAHLLSGKLPTGTGSAQTAASKQMSRGYLLPLSRAVARLHVAAVLRRATASEPSGRFATLQELEGSLVAALLAPEDPPTLRRLVSELGWSAVGMVVTPILAAVAAPYIPGACNTLNAVLSDTPFAGLPGLVCDAPTEVQTDPLADAQTEARRAFAAVRPKVVECALEEVKRRQRLLGEAKSEATIEQGLAQADAPAADAAREATVPFGASERAGSGSGANPELGSGTPERLPPDLPPPTRQAATSVPATNAVAVAAVQRPVLPPEGSPVAQSHAIEEVQREMGHLEVVAVVGPDGLSTELVVPHADWSTDARGCITVATEGIRFSPLLSQSFLVQSYALFGAKASSDLPDDVSDETLTNALLQQDADAELKLGACVSHHLSLPPGGSVHVGARFWVAAAGDSGVLEPDNLALPAAFQECAASVLAGFAAPPSQRAHRLTLAWNCSGGSQALCARDRTTPLEVARTLPTF